MRHQAFLFLFLCLSILTKAQNSTVEVKFLETYELANVILALTEYGISDPSEVQKGTPYYEEVMRYFKPVQDHPILKNANYSREKWNYFLSFRTDAFGFEINPQGQIQRRIQFFSNPPLHPFDDNLALIQDFYEKSKFHEFYQQHLAYYDGIASRYKTYFMVAEMEQFLIEEFGAFPANSNNLFVCSPLVNRMSCRRKIDKNTSADFATLALTLILPDQGAEINQELRASDIHLLFTEMDHGYVNPTTEQYAKILRKSFNYRKWDSGSGYKQACFNEYMTWAVYDLFTLKYFPQYADQVNRNWHFQNNTRGFLASGLFGRKLQELYVNRPAGTQIKDLFPAMLDWTKSVQNNLKTPKLLQDTLVVSQAQHNAPLVIQFSEPMEKAPVLDCVFFKMVNDQRERLGVITLKAGQTLTVQDKSLIINLPELPKEPGLYGLTFNIHDRKYELTAANGAAAPCPTRVYIRVW